MTHPAMTVLVRYEKVVQALAAALTIDEAKNIRDRAEAMRAYARQAKNRQLEIDAAEMDRGRSFQARSKISGCLRSVSAAVDRGWNY